MVGLQATSGSYKWYNKFSDVTVHLPASDLFVYLDESPKSLNDGYLEYVNSGATVNDIPAINHGKSTSFSYMDGHAELHRWRDVFLNPNLKTGAAGGSDTQWLAAHGTYLLGVGGF
jgi:hypothetical protein